MNRLGGGAHPENPPRTDIAAQGGKQRSPASGVQAKHQQVRREAQRQNRSSCSEQRENLGQLRGSRHPHEKQQRNAEQQPGNPSVLRAGGHSRDASSPKLAPPGKLMPTGLGDVPIEGADRNTFTVPPSDQFLAKELECA